MLMTVEKPLVFMVLLLWYMKSTCVDGPNCTRVVTGYPQSLCDDRTDYSGYGNSR